ncbi:retrovirus-related Pol polyprotein from type-1 retrotransposable element R2 [Trichonephila clavipes]|nr:retrovirus-related Pol polyprotein from type-1 retrotransposable element R2 [Trichonephila clavipes]
MARKRAENREGSLGFPGFVKPVFTKDKGEPLRGEDEGESADFTQRSAAKTLREQPPVVYSCERCSATTTTCFLSKDRLDRHVAQCHTKSSRSTETATSSITPSEKTVWCPHCARYLHLRQTLVQHIRVVHNESFTARKLGLARTKVVRFAADDVVDAAACSAAPAYHVLCPDGLRPNATTLDQPAQVTDGQQAGPSRDPGPPQPTGNSRVCVNTGQQESLASGFTCAGCGKVLKTRKGRTVHMLVKHSMSVGGSEGGGNNDEDVQRSTSATPIPSPPPPPEDQPPMDHETCRESTRQVGAVLIGGNLRLTFPLPRPLACPIQGCRNSFSGQKWTMMKRSLGRHIRYFHKLPNRRSEHWCAPCGRRIRCKPMRHPCLVNRTVGPNDPSANSWQCSECEMAFPSQLGLRNHEKTHRRQAIAEGVTPLVIPEGPARRGARRRRLAAISTGEPGDMPLAPPATGNSTIPHNTNASENSDPSPRGRIDIQSPCILASFVESLDALLEVDEIQDARSHFEDMVQHIVHSVQEYFHLQRPAGDRQTNGSSQLNTLDAQRVQQTYKWNRRKCIRAITDGTTTRCPVGKEDTYNHFKAIWESPSPPVTPPSRSPVADSLTPAFVESCLRTAENSSPGQDLITYRHWREIDPSCFILTKIFNICLKLADIPSAWKTSRTVLIHKKGDVGQLENWRPISLSVTIYKLFAKCMARKLAEWCENYEVISPCQNGFSPHDGVLEHNFLLTQHLETSRRCHKDQFVAWLDISNAFGSVPRQVMIDALVACGVDQDFVSLGPSHRPGKLGAKVHLGVCGRHCPDGHVRRRAPGDDVGHDPRIVHAVPGSQPRKCATLHLSGKAPTGARPTKFHLEGNEVQALGDGEYYSYLGCPVGFFLQKSFEDVNAALIILEKLSASQLAQWQKLDALKTFFFPTLSFSMRTAQLHKQDWEQVDIAARREIKSILSLPSNASNHYLYGNRKLGCCGFPSAAEDSDFYLVDSAFKLLTSRDEDVALQAMGQLTRTVRGRIGRSPTDGDCSSYLSGCMEDRYAETTNQLSNTWTRARKASTRLQVTWSFTNGKPSISFGDELLTPSDRRGVMKAFHDHFQVMETAKTLAAPSQGKALDSVVMAPASSHLISDGKFTRFADWRFIHKARLNLVPLNANKRGPAQSLRACRKCGQWDETLPHVLNHCTSYSAAWQGRHNAILARIRSAVAFKGTILSENQVVGPNRLRPDLVAQIENTIYIIDVTIPFENRKQAFKQARERKVSKYTELISHFNGLGFQQVQIVPILVGSLGAWDPGNDAFLRKVATNRYLATN